MNKLTKLDVAYNISKVYALPLLQLTIELRI